VSTTAVPVPDPTGAEAPAPAPTGPSRIRAALSRRLVALQEDPEAGMSTAEYAVGTVAACAFAAVLYRVVTGDSVVDGLTDLVDRALATLA
jgi:Protein of unknown function (DUF4244)